jgi:hypothetical protein
MLFGRNEDPPAPGLEWDRDGPWRDHAERARRTTIDHDGQRYVCRRVSSSKGAWELAYGTPSRNGQSRGFVFREGTLEWTTPLAHPVVGLVTDDGTVVLLEGGAADRLDGRLLAFDESGTQLLDHGFDVNVSDVDLSADGRLAVAQTNPPDGTTYVFDLQDGTTRLTHASEWATPRYARLYESERTWYAYLSNSLEKKPLYAVDLDGTVAWESRTYRQMKPLSARLKSRLS